MARALFPLLLTLLAASPFLAGAEQPVPLDLKSALDEIEGGWRAHNVGAIFRYVGESISMDLQDGAGERVYSHDQGYQTLQGYFGGIETVSFRIQDKSTATPVGDHVYRVRGEDENRRNHVYLTLEGSGGSYVLTAIRVY